MNLLLWNMMRWQSCRETQMCLPCSLGKWDPAWIVVPDVKAMVNYQLKLTNVGGRGMKWEVLTCKHHIKCTCSVKDRSPKAHSKCMYLLGKHGLCKDAHVCSDTLSCRRGPAVKEYLEYFCCKRRNTFGIGMKGDGKWGFLTMFTVFMILWGRKRRKELLLLTGEESGAAETQMNTLTCSRSYQWSVEIIEIIAHIRRMPSQLKC